MKISRKRVEELNVFCTQTGMYLECKVALIPKRFGSIYIDRRVSSMVKLNPFSREYEPILYVECEKEENDSVIYLFDYQKFRSLDINTYNVIEKITKKQASLVNRSWDSFYYKTVLAYGRMFDKMASEMMRTFSWDSEFAYIRISPVSSDLSIQLFGDSNWKSIDSVEFFMVDCREDGSVILYDNIFLSETKNAC